MELVELVEVELLRFYFKKKKKITRFLEVKDFNGFVAERNIKDFGWTGIITSQNMFQAIENGLEGIDC